MANVNVGQAESAAWNAYHGDGPEDQIHDEYWLFNRLSKGDAFVGFDGGTKITGAIEHSFNTNVEWISDYQTVATAKPDTFDQYGYNWKQIGGTAPISSQESAENRGSARKFDLKGAKLQNLSDTMKSDINAAMYSDGTGSSSKELGGLQYLISTTPNTGTVGEINRGTYVFYRNQQTTGTQTSSAFDNLRSSMRTLHDACSFGMGKKSPSFGVTTDTVMRGYEGLLIANERFTDKKDGDGGYKGEMLKFRGMGLAWDRDCPSGNLYMANEAYLKLGYLNGFWMKGYPSVDPANQFISVFKSETKCNLFSPQPRRLGVISAIS